MDLNDYLHTKDQQPVNPQEKEIALIKYTFIAACALKALAELALLAMGTYGGLGVLLSTAALVLFIFSVYNATGLCASKSLFRNAIIGFAAIFGSTPRPRSSRSSSRCSAATPRPSCPSPRSPRSEAGASRPPRRPPSAP